MPLTVVMRAGFLARVMIGMVMSHPDSTLKRSAIRRVATDARASWRHPG